MTLSHSTYFLCACLFRAVPEARGGSMARGRIRAAAAVLQQNQILTTSMAQAKACTISRLFNPLSKARDQICILMDSSWVPNPPSHNENSSVHIF